MSKGYKKRRTKLNRHDKLVKFAKKQGLNRGESKRNSGGR